MHPNQTKGLPINSCIICPSALGWHHCHPTESPSSAKSFWQEEGTGLVFPQGTRGYLVQFSTSELVGQRSQAPSHTPNPLKYQRITRPISHEWHLPAGPKPNPFCSCTCLAVPPTPARKATSTFLHGLSLAVTHMLAGPEHRQELGPGPRQRPAAMPEVMAHVTQHYPRSHHHIVIPGPQNQITQSSGSRRWKQCKPIILSYKRKFKSLTSKMACSRAQVMYLTS